MTLSVSTRTGSFVADGFATPRNIAFRLIDNSDLVVTADGVAQTLNVHYQLTGVYPAQQMIPITPYWANGAVVRYERQTPARQLYDLVAGVPMQAETMEKELDRNAMAVLDLSGEVDDVQSRALMVPFGEIAPRVASLVGAENKLLGILGGQVVPFDIPPKGDPGGDASQVGTRLQVETMSFDAGIDMIRTTGFATSNDGGAATYMRWQSFMPALVANQEGYAWVQSADGKRWVNGHIDLRPEMFGAMGHPTNDEGLPIRRMFEFASGRTVLITKTHRYKSQTAGVDDIRIYSNTRVQGISALTCGFKRIPNAVDEQLTTPSYGVWCQDTVGLVEINDIFHDVQRSGLGRPNENLQRVNGFLVRGKNERVRINRCITHNVTGYSFYQGALPGGNDFCDDAVYTDCIAYNSQVSFEATGRGTKAKYIRCHSRQYVIDGGAPVVLDNGFHQYSGVAEAYHYQCTHRGVNPAVNVAVVDAFIMEGIVYEDCDFESSSSLPTIIVDNSLIATVGNAQFGIFAKAKFIGGRIANMEASPTNLTGADVLFDGAQIVGQTVTLSAGPYSKLTLRGAYDIQCIVPVTASPASAAIAVLIDPAATATRTPTGSITATHLNGGSEVAIGGDITLVDGTFIDPPLGGGALGTEAPRHIQRLRGFKVEGGNGATDIINAGGNVYWASMVLASIPTGWTTSSQDTDFNKVTVQASLELAGQSGVVSTVPHGIHWYRRPAVAQGEVFFVVNSTAALPAGTRLRYDIIEEV